MSYDISTPDDKLVDDQQQRLSIISPIAISVIVLGCVFGGALVGLFFHSLLPSDYFDSDSKEAVRLGMALVGTTVAVALGLLIASGMGYYETQSAEVTQLAADVVLLDKILSHYGMKAKEIRDLLRSSVVHIVDVTWGQNSTDKTRFTLSAAGEALLVRIQELCPDNDGQRFLQSQAAKATLKLARTRSLMIAQKAKSIPVLLLAVLVFWLTLLFMSFGLFVRPNSVVVASLFVSALAVSCAIYLILEMYQPYRGLIQASSAPLRAALAQLGR